MVCTVVRSGVPPGPTKLHKLAALRTAQLGNWLSGRKIPKHITLSDAAGRPFRFDIWKTAGVGSNGTVYIYRHKGVKYDT